MRALLAVMIAICAACAPQPRTVNLIQAPSLRPPTTECPTPVTVDIARQARLESELEDVDRQLDAIDMAMLDTERTAGMTRDEALAEVGRFAMPHSLDQPSPDEPFLLSRIRWRHVEARRTIAALLDQLGPKHPDVQVARDRIARVAQEFEEQTATEISFAQAWGRELARLPVKAKPAEIVDARLRTLRSLLVSDRSGPVPSAAPAGVLIAAIELGELRDRRAELGVDLGPKHPEIAALVARIGEAERRLRAAVTSELVRTPQSSEAAATYISRRAELANRARVLRAELRR